MNMSMSARLPKSVLPTPRPTMKGGSRLLRTWIAAGIAALSAAAPVLVVANERAGFIIGFAGGAVNTDVSVDSGTGSGDGANFRYTDGDAFGYAAKLTIGGGIGNRFAVAGTLLQTLARIEGNQHDTHLLGVTGTFWLSPGRPSLYASLTLGRQTLLADIFDNRSERYQSSSVTDDAARIAIGYEFENRMVIETAMTAVESGGFRTGGGDVSVRQLQLLGGWHWY